MAQYEEHGRFYIERNKIADADGRVTEYFDVGEVIETSDGKRYKPSSDFGTQVYEEALAWIKAQG